MPATLSEADERKLVNKYGLAPCPTATGTILHGSAVVCIDSSTGKRRLARQCPACGWCWPMTGSVADHPAAPAFNITAASLRAAEVQAAQDRRNAAIRQRHAVAKANKPAADAAWFAWYNEYLRSEGWRRRRNLVMMREHGRCQAGLDGCSGRAEEVHHLSYNMMREGDMDAHQPLYDLVAICGPCHRRATEADRARRAK